MATSKIALIRRRRVTRPAHVRVPVQALPVNIAREYERELVSIMRGIHDKVKHAVLSNWPEPIAHTDAIKDPAGVTIGREIEGIKVDTYRQISSRRRGLIAQGVGQKVNKFTTERVGGQVKAVIGINPLEKILSNSHDGILPVFVKENVALIKTVPERYFAQVESLVTESLTIGRRAESIATLLEERFAVSESNAARIARDQVNKLNGQVTEARHRDLGITHYYWRTSRDERVRGDPGGKYPNAIPSHFDLEGKRFSWDDPPEPGHPGDDIECRCRAEPDMSALL